MISSINWTHLFVTADASTNSTLYVYNIHKIYAMEQMTETSDENCFLFAYAFSTLKTEKKNY